MGCQAAIYPLCGECNNTFYEYTYLVIELMNVVFSIDDQYLHSCLHYFYKHNDLLPIKTLGKFLKSQKVVRRVNHRHFMVYSLLINLLLLG